MTRFDTSNSSDSSVPRLRAATLAVGTEVVDGQITDRNSGWISQMVSESGVQVIEHRAVADDRRDISRALEELAQRADLLFVTGGLGPTSDDFTRELISAVFNKPLEFDLSSWEQIQSMLLSRGIAVKEVQRQQCYFPRGSRVLKNPVGTANGFTFQTAAGEASAHELRVYALPGPPSEIAAIWDLNLKLEMAELIPADRREELVILRCLGKPESDVAEITEAAIAGSGLRVGYRAHLPYIEVKLWVPAASRQAMQPVINKVEADLGDWIISRGKEDLADPLLQILNNTQQKLRTPVEIIDGATAGFLQDRLVGRTRELKYKNENMPFVIQTRFGNLLPIDLSSAELGRPQILISLSGSLHAWVLELKNIDLGQVGAPVCDLKLKLQAPSHYSLDSERARKFLTELIFLSLKQHVEKIEKNQIKGDQNV